MTCKRRRNLRESNWLSARDLFAEYVPLVPKSTYGGSHSMNQIIRGLGDIEWDEEGCPVIMRGSWGVMQSGYNGIGGFAVAVFIRWVRRRKLVILSVEDSIDAMNEFLMFADGRSKRAYIERQRSISIDVLFIEKDWFSMIVVSGVFYRGLSRRRVDMIRQIYGKERKYERYEERLLGNSKQNH